MPVVGMTSTNEEINSDIPVREMGDIGLLEPNEAPLVTLITRAPVKAITSNTKFEWKEDDFVGRWTTVTTLVAANATAVIVADSTIFTAGDIVLVAPSNVSNTAPERFRIQSINRGTSTLTVVRYLGGVATGATIPANTPILHIGMAADEGGGIPEAKRTTPVNLSNYTQIFKTAGDWTRSAMATKTYVGGVQMYDSKKMAVDHKRSMNRSLLYGVPSESLAGGTNGKPVRTSGGLISRITTNVADAGGTLTLANFLTYMDTAFRYGSDTKFALCSGIFLNAINTWSMSKMLVQPDRTEFGMNVTRVTTTYGQLVCVLDRALENSGSFGFGNQVIIVDPTEIGQRTLEGNGVSGSTKLYENALMTGLDSRTDYLITECGWEIKQEKKHMKIFNVTGYSATL